MPNGWRTIKSLVHRIRLHGRRGKGMAESFSREKLSGHRRMKVEKSCVTPGGASATRMNGMTTHTHFFFFSLISLIADGPHHYHPACGHEGSSHISPRFTPYDFLSRCKFSTLTTRQPMVEFYLLTFPRFPLRKKEYKSNFGKNRTHDFRTSRCAGYLLDHSGDETLAEIFLCRRKRCAGVVGTRTDWVLKGEEGGMTTPLLQYVARFDVGAIFLGLEGEVTRRIGRGAPCLSSSRLYLLQQAASNQLYPCVGGGQACPPFPAFSAPRFSPSRAL